MGVDIRLAGVDDYPVCVELLQLLSQATDSASEPFTLETFNQVVANQRAAVLLAQEQGKVLGMASISFNLALRYDGEYCQLEELIVAPTARGKNVGGLLMEETIRVARLKRCKEFGLYLLAATEHNQPFYEKYGFIRMGAEMRQSL